MAVKTTVDSVSADGTKGHATYSATYDGKPAPVTGSRIYDMVTRKRISPTTTEVVYLKGAKVVTTNTAVVWADGKTMTITATGVDAAGKPVNSVALYTKQ